MKLFCQIRKLINEIIVLLIYKSGEGNISSFLDDRLGKTIPSILSSRNELDFYCRWRYKQDRYGIVIRLYGIKFDTINKFFSSLLGKPSISFSKNIYGYPQVAFHGKYHKNYHLQYSQFKNYIEIICIKSK